MTKQRNHDQEWERQQVLEVRLPALYREREDIRRQSPNHDSSLTHAQDTEIVRLEKLLRLECGEPYRLVELQFASAATREATEIWQQTKAVAEKVQRLSQAGDTTSTLYRETARDLESLGVAFACLYSDPQTIFVIKGEAGMVHNHIREVAARLRETGAPVPLRPDAPGFLIRLNRGTYVFRTDSFQLIWTTQLATDARGYAVASLVSVDLHQLGTASLAGASLNPLMAVATDKMENLLSVTRNKLK